MPAIARCALLLFLSIAAPAASADESPPLRIHARLEPAPNGQRFQLQARLEPTSAGARFRLQARLLSAVPAATIAANCSDGLLADGFE